MLLSRLAPLTTTAMLLLGSSLASAQSPMDPSHSTKRDTSIAASYGDMNSNDLGFTPRLHPRSIFEKRQTCGSSSDNICTQTGNIIRCCPSDYECFYADGDWRCDPNVLGLTRGQKIGIGIGVTVAFFVLCILALVVFCCCCRAAAKVAGAAVNNSNNNNNNVPQGVYQPQGQPMVYGHVGGQQGYDPAAIPLTQVGQDGKPYADNMGYYPPPPQQQQGGYDQYGQQAYAPPPVQQPYQPASTPAPPYQQSPPHGQYHQ